MADFEELKLTVSLQDDASAGLANIRTQLTQLTQTAGQVQTALGGVATGAQQVGNAVQQAAPRVSNAEKTLKELGRSAEETTRGLLQTVLAARRGAEAFPELALGLREASQGLKGVNAGMAELAPAARLAVVGLGAVAIGVTAVGAALVAYGVSVFRFSREMYALGQTARSLGITFGAMKNLTEQNERYGISAETTAAQVGRLQEAITNLSENNSSLRQQLIGKGLDPNWLNQYQQETDLIVQQNMARQKGLDIVKAREAEGRGHMAAVGEASAALRSLGQDPTIMDRDAATPLTEKQKEQAQEIDRLSGEIAKQWRGILETASDIKTEVLAWGLPRALDVITGFNSGLKEALGLFESIGSKIEAIKNMMPDWMITALGKIGSFEKGALPGVITHDPVGALTGGVRGLFSGDDSFNDRFQSSSSPLNGRNAEAFRDAVRRRYQPSSFRTGANDNNPLLHRASFGDDDGGGRGRAQEVIKGGVFDALVQFSNYMRTGSTAGGGGGIQNASFGGVEGFRGGTAGGARPSGGAASFGSAEFPNLGNGAGQVPRALGGAPNGSDTGPPTGTPAAGAMGDPAVPSHILDQAKAVALHSGPGGVEAFMRSQGYPKAGNWCGEFAASVVKSAGGTPPQNPAIASNWRNWGSPVEGAPQPGDVAVRKGARTGSTGSHVAFVENYDPKTGTFTALGGNQGRMESPGRNANQYDFRRGGKVDLPAVAANAGVAGAAGGNIKGVGEVNDAIRSTASKAGMDEAHWKAIASIESGLTPGSNANKATQYKGLFQVGRSEWARTGQGNIYNARDNAESAARLAQENAAGFKKNFGRDPTPGEIYLMHQQGLGFYTAGKMTNIAGNPYPGMRGPQTHESFERGWTNEVNRRAAGFTDRAALDRPLDRNALNDNNSIHSTGKLDVNVSAPPGTKVNYHGQNLLKNTSMQRQTQMMPTQGGPSVGDTAASYMRGGG